MLPAAAKWAEQTGNAAPQLRALISRAFHARSPTVVYARAGARRRRPQTPSIVAFYGGCQSRRSEMLFAKEGGHSVGVDSTCRRGGVADRHARNKLTAHVITVTAGNSVLRTSCTQQWKKEEGKHVVKATEAQAPHSGRRRLGMAITMKCDGMQIRAFETSTFVYQVPCPM